MAGGVEPVGRPDDHVRPGLPTCGDQALQRPVRESVVGVQERQPPTGRRSHAGVAAQMFKALSEKGINILAISTSEIKISVLIDAAYAELAVRTLHTVYGLDAA